MKRIAILGIVAAFVIITVFMGVYILYIVKSPISLEMHGEVSDKIGFNLDADAIKFGKLFPGATSRRAINLTNSYQYPIYFSVRLSGDIAKYVSVSQNEGRLEPSEVRSLTYYFSPSKSTGFGNYSGVTSIQISRVIFP
ncbi:MAG: hypothetical protein HGA85_07255 [Nanoarchaeota archaeon]|nr:hypothetical protein [Nanoarchaeota archaeon]